MTQVGHPPANTPHDDHHHGHGHDHSHGPHHHGIKNIRAAILINFAFAIFELISGILCNSVAITSGAIHDLGDTLALSMSYFSEKYAKRKVLNYTYGLHRLPLLSALLNSLILLGGSVAVLASAIPRLQHPEIPKADWMIGVAIVGVVANGWAAFRLHGTEGLNARALNLHLLEDILGWVAVLVGAVVMYFFNWSVIDPILSIVISVYILVGAGKNLYSTMQLFLQKAPSAIDIQKMKDFIVQLPEVSHLSDFHLWSLEGMHHVLTMHLVLKRELSLAECELLKHTIRQHIRQLGKLHTTIEIESSTTLCTDHCGY